MSIEDRDSVSKMNSDCFIDSDGDIFLEPFDNSASIAPLDLRSLISDEHDDNGFDDCRMSFSSAISSFSSDEFRRSFNDVAATFLSGDYEIWTTTPGSITERRRKLLRGMGLSGGEELFQFSCASFSAKPDNNEIESTSTLDPDRDLSDSISRPVMVRSRSESDIWPFAIESERRRELIGTVPKQRLSRTYSTTASCSGFCGLKSASVRVSKPVVDGVSSSANRVGGGGVNSLTSGQRSCAFFLIRNLDTGNEFIVNEFDSHGMCNKFRDMKTGKQLSMDEFEKSLGYSPVVKELMRRESFGRLAPTDDSNNRKSSAPNSSYLSRSFRYSKKRGVSLLKNIRGVANSMSAIKISEKETENHHSTMMRGSGKPLKSFLSSVEWIKVRSSGKQCKELTALHLCQEIQAHSGSIWTIRFSLDDQFLASAGEDKVIHVWKVETIEVMPDEWSSFASSTPLHPLSSTASPDRAFLTDAADIAMEKRRKGKCSFSSKRANPFPDYVYPPDMVFSLSEKPVCSFTGHFDDVLDLSWSKSQFLLSSSMDKTVRLWDMKTGGCLKLFAHNDYVTCIQFNPVDDRFFISGSLDAKVRLWSVPDRQVVDWIDVHEMVTAASYTPDGQGAIIGSHRGNCRYYNTSGCKLSEVYQFDIDNKKKSQGKKITGFEFAPQNPLEVLITSADSNIRIYNGSDLTCRFKGFRNTSSQISGCFTRDGKYVISASEDSHVYVWKREDTRSNGTSGGGSGSKAKSPTNTRSHEQFLCKGVSVAVPWRGHMDSSPPPFDPSSTSVDFDGNQSSKRQSLPPLPRRPITSAEETPFSSFREDELSASSRTDSSDEYRFPACYDDSPSVSASMSWNEGQAATAWGMVVVTAGLDGHIRAYQNFGLPVRVGRQGNNPFVGVRP